MSIYFAYWCLARPGGSSPGTQPRYAQGLPPAGGWKRHMAEGDEYSPEFQDEYRRLWHELTGALGGEPYIDAMREIAGLRQERDKEFERFRETTDAVMERAEKAERERDEAREKLDAIDPLCAHPSVEAALRELGGRVNAAEADREQLREALADNDRDARWIVGQWQRLQDEPVKEVASAIVERVRAALAATGATKEEDE